MDKCYTAFIIFKAVFHGSVLSSTGEYKKKIYHSSCQCNVVFSIHAPPTRSGKWRNDLLKLIMKRSLELKNWPIWQSKSGLWKNEDIAQPRCHTNVNIGTYDCCWHNIIKLSQLHLRVQLHVHIHQSKMQSCKPCTRPKVKLADRSAASTV